MPASTPRSTKTPQSKAGGPDNGLGVSGRLMIGAASVVLMILLWKLAASIVGKELILPPPDRVLGIAFGLYPTSGFLEALAQTFLRGLSAFAMSCVAGGAVGLAAGRWPRFGAAIAPLVTVIRATPVLALILLILLWFPSGFVPIFAAFLMAFPVMLTSAMQGSKASDPQLLEMAALFRVPTRLVFRRLALPSAAPFLLAGARNSLGLCWKVVVAGEVLSQPISALGTGMQEARTMLETGTVFAWAAAAILLCGASEWLFALFAKGISRRVL